MMIFTNSDKLCILRAIANTEGDTEADNGELTD